MNLKPSIESQDRILEPPVRTSIRCDCVTVCFPGPQNPVSAGRPETSTIAVDSFSHHFEVGTITSLVGPSGCGKTTLLRTIAGLQSASSGSVLFEPRQPSSKIGMVFQKPALMPWLTVRENVALPLKLGRKRDRSDYPSSGSEADGEVNRLLDHVELTAAADLYPRQLSGGMQMRVSVARGLITSPSILLLDEPFAALDEVLRHQLGELLHRLHSKRSFTGVLVTHNIAESISLSHHVLVMQNGHLTETIPNPLPWPRATLAQSDPRFAEIYSRISTAMIGKTVA